MAFCKNCGTQLDDSYKVCPNCGQPVAAQPVAQPQAAAPATVEEPKGPWKVFAILGLIFGIMSRKKNPVNNGMATAGIVLSIISLVLGIIVLIWSFAVTGSFIGFIEDAAQNGDLSYSYYY